MKMDTRSSLNENTSLETIETSHNSQSDADEDSSNIQDINYCQPSSSTINLPKNNVESDSSGDFLELYYYDNSSSEVKSSSSESAESQENDFVHSSFDESDTSEADSDSDSGKKTLQLILSKKPPKSDWSVTKDVINRQIGFNNSVPSRFYRSLQAVQRLELMYKLEYHAGCVNALSFNQTGNLLASASDDLGITLWNWAIGKKHQTFRTDHISNVFQAKWLPLDTERFLVSSAYDGQVRLIDIPTAESRKLAEHRAACHKISTHLELPHVILSAGEDSQIFSIDVREKKPTKLLSVDNNGRKVRLYSIHSNPLNNFEFCVAGRMNSINIYDRRQPITLIKKLSYHWWKVDAESTCAVYNYNGTEIVASYLNEDIYLFDLKDSSEWGEYSHRYRGHRSSSTIKGVNFFGPNSEYVTSGSDCGNIFIWDKKTEALVQCIAGDDQKIVNAVEPHPYVPILATSGLDYDVKIWIPSRETAPNLEDRVKPLIQRLRNHYKHR